MSIPIDDQFGISVNLLHGHQTRAGERGHGTTRGSVRDALYRDVGIGTLASGNCPAHGLDATARIGRPEAGARAGADRRKRHAAYCIVVACQRPLTPSPASAYRSASTRSAPTFGSATAAGLAGAEVAKLRRIVEREFEAETVA